VRMLGGPPKLLSQTCWVMWSGFLLLYAKAEVHSYRYVGESWAFLASIAALALPFVVVMLLGWRFARRLRLAAASGGPLCVNCYYEIGHQAEGTEVCTECGYPLAKSLEWRDWEPLWLALWHRLIAITGRMCKCCGRG